MLGEVLGYAATSDAHHLTAPDPSGESAALAITRALADAGLAPEDLDYVNAHGTSTPLNDRSETEALKLALGEARATACRCPRRSRRSGICSARPGAVEAVATVLALRDRVAPPTLGYEQQDEGLDLDYVAERPPAAADTPERPRPQAGDRDLELIRLRRTQRGAVPGGGGMSTLTLAAPPEAQQLTAIERLEVLCDPGSLQVIRSEVISPSMGEKARAGDGVIGGAGLVDGRPVLCYAQDSRYAGGSLGEQHANTIVRVLELADRARAPVVGFVASGGARMQEGVAALGGYGRIFHRIVGLSGRVPQISIITGLSAGGGAYSPALTDWTVMTEDSSMFLTGPAVVRDALGEDVSAAELGGTRVHERNGVCHFVSPRDFDAALLVTRATRLPPEPPEHRRRRCCQAARRPGAIRRPPCPMRRGACTTCAT